MVSAVLAQLSRPEGNDGGARSHGRSRDYLAVGSALCAHFKSAASARTTASESILAGGRNVRSGSRKLGVLVSSRRFGPRYHRSHVVAQPGYGCCQALLAIGVAPNRARVINVDGHPAYATAVSELKQSGESGRRCRCRPSQYMNNVLEQDHRFIKKRIAAGLWFRSVSGALKTIARYESMHMIRKGQIRWLPKGDVVGQIWFIHQVYGIAA
jgi:hypothetical protein